ncbi:FliO/MopB family protein [Emcibacter nanhaiensis]|uniref:FliO/MopB family protein n=1 Tax=Emcibacter nanhaiensis TaxID=1505037 RepID=A0A501PQP4_9PROT|nr:flagellar biosynthetic protein FliO [Emcibacter nanhaiensis]TPD62850.1 FliO/MopB family protein [Emcibacter nanhaiensis]
MDVISYGQYLVALLFVIALLFGLAYAAKKMGLSARVTINSPKANRRRLNIVEILPIDTKRKLILIRRDQTEHLLMLGTENDLLVEQNIPVPESENIAREDTGE